MFICFLVTKPAILNVLSGKDLNKKLLGGEILKLIDRRIGKKLLWKPNYTSIS